MLYSDGDEYSVLYSHYSWWWQYLACTIVNTSLRTQQQYQLKISKISHTWHGQSDVYGPLISLCKKTKDQTNAVKLCFRCILISRFWNVEISLHFNLAFSHCSTSIYQALMGKLNFHGYLILRFYPTCEICENLMHVKNMFYSIPAFYSQIRLLLKIAQHI